MASNTLGCSVCHQAALVGCMNDKQYFCQSHLDAHNMFSCNQSHKLIEIMQKPENPHNCVHVLDQGIYCMKHGVLCCENCKATMHSQCNCEINVGDLLKEKPEVIRTCFKQQDILKTQAKAATNGYKALENQFKTWEMTLQESMNHLKQLVGELEQKIDSKILKEKDIITKNAKTLKMLQQQLGEGIQGLEIAHELKEDQPKLDVVKALLKAKGHLKKSAEQLKTCIVNPYTHCLQEEHKFEAQHYVDGTFQKLAQSVEKVRKDYEEIMKYHLQNSQSHNDHDSMPLPICCTDLETTEDKRPVQDETTRKEEITETGQNRSQQTIPRIRKQSSNLDVSHLQRMFSENYESMMSQNERDQYQSIPTLTQCCMKVRTEEDKHVSAITGLSAIENNAYLVMADYQNSTLKLFATCGNLECEIRCEEIPRDLAKIDDSTILVNFPMAKKVRILKIQFEKNTGKKQMVFDEQIIQTHAKCCGIAYFNEKIYIATQLPHQVLIMNLYGKLLYTIEGKELFDRATYIAINPETGVIYISDPSKKSIIGIDDKGTKVFQYAVDAPHGLTYAGNNKLLVADWTSGIHLVDLSNAAGSHVGDLKLKDCLCPQKIVYDLSNKKLFVTQWDCSVVRTICLGNF
ncbi:uncharacterized protein LOC127833232 [Dreissena polymorpha]|uniref:B box-type domain-containing protein n=1 Tax=Dreissena polymorpha TaxID=45954 RepID=A0A9D4RXT9_DREPO|nr:uncharacterized protein LOC127833232 [Dreissena polymorpha]KAH3882960.1 hypothetical protein DPMN_006907 [Dreissena polymorpha]